MWEYSLYNRTFYFGSSLINNCGGSSLKKNHKDTEKEMTKRIAMGERVCTRTIENNGSSKNYLNNLFIGFDHHYNKFNQYQKKYKKSVWA